MFTGTWPIPGYDLSSDIPGSKVHGANMGPTWVLSAPDGPHVGPMNRAIREVSCDNPPDLKMIGHFSCPNTSTSMLTNPHLQAQWRFTLVAIILTTMSMPYFESSNCNSFKYRSPEFENCAPQSSSELNTRHCIRIATLGVPASWHVICSKWQLLCI